MSIKKGIISIILGWLSLITSYHCITIDRAYDAYIHIGLILCLFCGMAFGAKYALLCFIPGMGIFFPFVIWGDYGFANIITCIFTFIWIISHSICRKFISDKKLPFFSVYIVQAAFILIYMISGKTLVKSIIKLNSPFLNGHYCMSYIPDNIVNVNSILFAEITTIMLFTVNIIISTRSFNKLMKSTIPEYGNYIIPAILIASSVAFLFSIITTSSENNRMAISFSVNSYQSTVGNVQLTLLKAVFIIFIADFMIHFIEYRNNLSNKEQISTNRYLNIFRNILDIYIEFDSEYKIITVSPSALKVFEYEADELKDKSIIDFFIDDAYKEDFINCTNKIYDARDHELKIKTKSGKTVCLLVSKIDSLNENDMIFIARDITERKKRQEKQEEMSQMRTAILESSDDVIFCIKKDKIIARNKSACRFFMQKCGCEDPVRFRDIFNFNERKEWKVFIDKTVKSGEYNTEYFDETIGKYYDVRFKRISYGAEKMDISIFAKDITELKTKEQQTKMMNEELEYRVLERTKEITRAYSELENFCAVVAHEFRSPVRAISLYNDMIKEDLPPNASEDSIEAVESIHNYCENSLEMIENLLEYSKIKSKKITIQQINMKMIIENCLRELRIINSNLDIRVHIDEIPNIIGDEFLMRHAIYNILSNSIKYSSSRDHIEINVTYVSNRREHILSFADNGVGFDMNGAEKVFGIFDRMHTDKEFKGTGIGLATVKNIIQKHGGSIYAKSEIDKGCIIIINLPK